HCRTLNFIEPRRGLFAVVFHKLPVWVYLESGFFAIGCQKDLVVPLTIGIVFPYYLNDLSACRLFFDCLLDRRRERFEIDLFLGILSRLSGRAQTKPDADSRY